MVSKYEFRVGNVQQDCEFVQKVNVRKWTSQFSDTDIDITPVKLSNSPPFSGCWKLNAALLLCCCNSDKITLFQETHKWRLSIFIVEENSSCFKLSAVVDVNLEKLKSSWNLRLSTRLGGQKYYRKCLNVHSVCTNFCLNVHSVCTNFCLNVHSPGLLWSPCKYGKGMYKFVLYA